MTVRRRMVAVALLAGLVTTCSSTNRTVTDPDAARSADDEHSSAATKGAASAATSGAEANANANRAERAEKPGTAATGSSTRLGAPDAPGGITIPETGRGWDRENVFIGVTTNQDIQQFAETVGVNTLDSGDQRAYAETMIETINASGGIFGRRVKGIYLDIKSSGSRESSGQAACAHFTEDHEVVAVISGALQNDTESFRACMAKHGLPVIALGAQPFDAKVFDQLDGYYHHIFATWDRLAPALVRRLVAQKYFSSWDTSRGAPGAGPVRIGLLAADSAIGRRVAGRLSDALSRVGHKPVRTFYYADASTLEAGVLRFRSDNVTHVISTDQFLFLFATKAESQGYRPRYGVSTANATNLLLQGTAPHAQLAGSVGLGFIPTLDVDAGRDPGKEPWAARCRAIMTKAGHGNASDERFAIAYSYGFCDAFRLLQSAAVAGEGLTGEQLRDGIPRAGKDLLPALTFRSGMTPQNRVIPGAGMDLRWDIPCGCYRYGGSSLHAI